MARLHCLSGQLRSHVATLCRQTILWAALFAQDTLLWARLARRPWRASAAGLPCSRRYFFGLHAFAAEDMHPQERSLAHAAQMVPCFRRPWLRCEDTKLLSIVTQLGIRGRDAAWNAKHSKGQGGTAFPPQPSNQNGRTPFWLQSSTDAPCGRDLSLKPPRGFHTSAVHSYVAKAPSCYQALCILVYEAWMPREMRSIPKGKAGRFRRSRAIKTAGRCFQCNQVQTHPSGEVSRSISRPR